jgi:hypothetical protein
MLDTRFAALVVIGCTAGIAACQGDPAVATDADVFAASITETAGAAGPFLLEIPHDPEPSKLSCVTAVNNEGMMTGWHVVQIPGGSTTVEAVAVWNRTGKLIRTWSIGSKPSVIDINDRGQILTRDGEPPYSSFEENVFVSTPDGSSAEAPLPSSAATLLTNDPVRLNRLGHVMATYLLDPESCRYDPCPPFESIVSTGLGALKPPPDPSKQPPGLLPEADCRGEAIDDNGAVYGSCLVNGQRLHYRWITRDQPTVFPPKGDAIRYTRIHDVNRYGQLVAEAPGTGVFWSQATGRFFIPLPPGVIRQKPVAINDRGVVLLSSNYTEGLTQPATTVAYWTLTSGTVVLPKGKWPVAAVHDINNQGVIVGCVGGDGEKELVPAYWRIQ